MEAQKERDAFSVRLKEALARQGWPEAGPADVVREFNRRFPVKMGVRLAFTHLCHLEMRV
jgi:hypothetical protein